MKQKLLTDIELDVHELKCLMDLYSKEPTQTLSELFKRTIQQMQGRLDLLMQELESIQDSSLSSFVVAEVVKTPTIEKEDIPVIEEAVFEKDVEETVLDKVALEDTILGEDEPIVAEGDVVAEDDVVAEPEFKSSVLGENLKMSAGLRQSISLNDSFRFSRELFGGDTELMNRVIEQISVMSSYKTAIVFLSSKVNINEENEALNDLLELLKKFFNQSV